MQSSLHQKADFFAVFQQKLIKRKERHEELAVTMYYGIVGSDQLIDIFLLFCKNRQFDIIGRQTSDF